MCGFLGFVGDRERAAAIDLDVALAALRHRGPDDRGVFSSPLTPHSPACVLAHTRLAIIDLSAAAHQPMTTSDGRYTIVYNGEVYNFRELRQDLGVRSQEWRSDSDTEVVLRAFAAWGKDCVKRFRGMFAFAIWDDKERSLFLARDRMGVKPLYYAASADGLAFSSEVRSLLSTGLASRRLSPAGLASYLAFGSAAEPQTIVHGIFTLPPGHIAQFRDGALETERYWEIPFGRNGIAGAGEAVERLRPLLREAVALRLISDVPLGVFLSGGIDSAAVAALAAEASRGPVETFTLAFDEAKFDETAQAAQTAKRFGCAHHQVRLPASRALTEIDAGLAAMDQPSADGLNTFFVARAAREAGLTVALSGLGGDEVFAGYASFRTFGRLLSAGRAARLAPTRAIRALLDANTFNGLPNRWKKLGSALACRGDLASTYTVLREMFSPRQRRQLLAADLPSGPSGTEIPGALARAPRAGALDAVNALSALELSNYLRNTLLRDTDSLSMASSLEVRVPLLDHELVELAASIPGRAKLSKTANKPLLVDAVGTLPPGIGGRAKRGFTLPLETWLRGPLRERARELLSSGPAGLWNPAGLEKLWSSFLHGEQYVSSSRVWTIAALNAWCGENGVRSQE
jgi:asparagine synthase (glutamine-hydrolysing)